MIGVQGGGTMLEILLEAGADANAKNSNGLGTLRGDRQSSTSVRLIAEDCKIRNTHGRRPPAKKSGSRTLSTSKAVRHSTLQSYDAGKRDHNSSGPLQHSRQRPAGSNDNQRNHAAWSAWHEYPTWQPGGTGGASSSNICRNHKWHPA